MCDTKLIINSSIFLLNVFIILIWIIRKHVSRRQNSIAEMVLKSIEERCDVKIICEGREVIDEMINGCTSQHDEGDGFVSGKPVIPKSFWLFRSRYDWNRNYAI